MGTATAPAATIRHRRTARRTRGRVDIHQRACDNQGHAKSFSTLLPPQTHRLSLRAHVPADPADHAEDFAHRYPEPLDWQACLRMEGFGIPKDRIGANHHLHGLVGRAFNPFEREGGGINHAGQVNIDSGISIRS